MSTSPEIEGTTWTLDEYAVVADLYLRRGRTTGVRDPEAIELAALTGRSPASISRRIGNYRGTDVPGEGLKPVTGDALALFTNMRDDETWRAERVKSAREALARRGAGPAAPAAVSSAPRQATLRFGRIEANTAESFDVPVRPAREHQRREAALVKRYCESRGQAAQNLTGVTIEAAGGLRVDLFDKSENVLIEAKPDSSRSTIRLLLGQLLDYVRYFDPQPRLAALLPSRPVDDLVDLLGAHGVSVIYEGDGGFEIIPAAA